MTTVKCPNCRKRTVLPAIKCAYCGTTLNDAIQKQLIEAKIREIRQEYEKNWLRQPNVVSVSTRKDDDGDYYIEVGVANQEQGIDVPELIDGVPVRIETIGRIHPATVES